MRNIWYPKGMAEYVTSAKLHELGMKKDFALERDSTFRSNTEKKIERQTEVPDIEEEAFVPQAPLVPSYQQSIPQEVYDEPQIQIELMKRKSFIYASNQLLTFLARQSHVHSRRSSPT